MPTEVAIASSTPIFANVQDQYTNYSQPLLFQYKSVLYQVAGNVFNAHAFHVFKSVDFGNTWTCPGSGTCNGQALLGVQVFGVGTLIYIWTTVSGSSSNTALWTYDVTTDTLATVTTTGTVAPALTSTMRIAGPDSSHIYTINDSGSGNVINVWEYLSLVATNIGTMTDAGVTLTWLQTAFCGASGIIHVFYIAAAGGGTPKPVLKYFNVNAGVISSPVTVISNFSDTTTALGPGTTSQLSQIGGNIYFTFYLPSASQVQICSFTDVAIPVFTITVVDPSWTITPSIAQGGTGYYITNLLSLAGAALICFYTNTNYAVHPAGGAAADDWLYCRVSTDLGVTWGALQQIIQHTDPGSGLKRPVDIICPINSIAGTFPFNPLFASYAQIGELAGGVPPSGNDSQRYVAVCPSPPPPPPVASGWGTYEA